jgi:hypothetical protein
MLIPAKSVDHEGHYGSQMNSHSPLTFAWWVWCLWLNALGPD